MRLQKPSPEKWTTLNGLDISYVSDFAMDGFKSDIFEAHQHWFSSTVERPYIIDAGANTGCVTLYLKQLYPNADVICFEPDVDIFHLLEQNIKANALSGTTLFNCALGDYDGSSHFYTSKAKHLSGGLGNSIKPVWGIQEHLSQYDTTMKVPIRRLSRFINRPVDYLKLDVEGAELDILNEISTRIHHVKQLHVEVHCLGSQPDIVFNHLSRFLDKHEFYTLVERYQATLPRWVQRWNDGSKPSIWSIRAVNSRFFTTDQLTAK